MQVREETGLDISDMLVEEDCIERHIKQQRSKLYIITGVRGNPPQLTKWRWAFKLLPVLSDEKLSTMLQDDRLMPIIRRWRRPRSLSLRFAGR